MLEGSVVPEFSPALEVNAASALGMFAAGVTFALFDMRQRAALAEFVKRLDRRRLYQLLALSKLLVELRSDLLALRRLRGRTGPECKHELAALVKTSGTGQVSAHFLRNSLADAEA
jgi:hypothetical protein